MTPLVRGAAIVCLAAAAWCALPAGAQTGAAPTASPAPGATAGVHWVLACDGTTVGIFSAIDATDPKLAQALRDPASVAAAPAAKSPIKNVEILLRNGTAEPGFVQWIRDGAAGVDVAARNCTVTKAGSDRATPVAYTLRHALPAADSVLNGDGLTAALVVGTLQFPAP